MFDRRRLRRLPPDIQHEVETLISDLTGERWLPFPPTAEDLPEGVELKERHNRESGAHDPVPQTTV
jgi:hypothetical protein